MIIEIIYRAESKQERKTLLMMNITMQNAGMDVDLIDDPEAEACRLMVKESRRQRKSKPVEVGA